MMISIINFVLWLFRVQKFITLNIIYRKVNYFESYQCRDIFRLLMHMCEFYRKRQDYVYEKKVNTVVLGKNTSLFET